MVRRAAVRIAFALCCVVATPAVATESSLKDASPAEARMLPYSGLLPACDDGYVLERIQEKFRDRESEYWNSGLAIEGFARVRETSLRGNGASYIPRRYCEARVRMNDGREREVVYELGEDLGFIGFDYGVTWCVVGLDRNHAFSPGCKAAGR
ncbi:MAG: hypothetical protein WB816_15150 [Methylocystis sp.]